MEVNLRKARKQANRQFHAAVWTFFLIEKETQTDCQKAVLFLLTFVFLSSLCAAFLFPSHSFLVKVILVLASSQINWAAVGTSVLYFLILA